MGHKPGDWLLQPGEPTIDLLQTCDGPGGPPWDHPWLDRIGGWLRHRKESSGHYVGTDP